MDKNKKGQPLEDRALKAAAQFMGEELLPQPERIQRSLRMLRKERECLTHEDLMRMQAVLYTLAMKFLTIAELGKIKEELGMTVLGEMIRKDGVKEGIEQGIERGIEKGIRELILDNLEEGIQEDRILEKLTRRFQLDARKAKEYYDRFSAESENKEKGYQ